MTSGNMGGQGKSGAKIKGLAIIIAPIVSFLFVYFADLDPEHPEVTKMAGIAILMAVAIKVDPHLPYLQWARWCLASILTAYRNAASNKLFLLKGVISGSILNP